MDRSSLIQRSITESPGMLFETIFSKVSEGIMVTDTARRIVHVNPAFEIVTGYKMEEVLGRTPGMLQSGMHDAAFYGEMWQRIDDKGEWQGEIWNKRKNGEVYPEWLSISAIRNEEGRITNYCGIFSDLSDHHVTEQKLKKMALTDPLTGVSNRHDFSERFEHILQSSEKYDIQHAVLFLDLDRFKQINDTFGHGYGDMLLIELAKRLGSLLKNKDLLARYGGDEFLIAQTSVRHIRETVKLAGQIIEALEKPFHLSGETFHVSASIGISLYPHDGASREELIRKADQAMYVAKNNGRSQFYFFHDEMKTPEKRYMILEGRLRKAIDEKRFRMAYQPKIDLQTDKVTGYEALVRWHDELLGDVSPAEFIPHAEENGLIIPISEAIFEKVCEDFTEHWMTKESHMPIAVNISAIHFQQANFVPSLRKIFEKWNVPPASFELELTEHTIMTSGPAVEERLQQLKRAGFRLTIDDFGTGYSSLAYLSRFPLDCLKIDRSFIDGINKSEENEHIVKAIIQLSHSLEMNVIAEGVETDEQSGMLRTLGCDIAQGYLFSPPLTPEGAVEFPEIGLARYKGGNGYYEI